MVNFLVAGMTGDNIELSTESAKNFYIIRVSRGAPGVARFHNMRAVDSLPKSNLTKLLEEAYKAMALDLEELFRLPFDSLEYRVKWWEIKGKCYTFKS
jgi:ubiquinone biosynthesis protein Coq4